MERAEKEEESKPSTKAELEAWAEAMRKALLSVQEATVSREEFDALKDTVLDGMQKQPAEPSEPKKWECTEKGCPFKTYDIEAFVDHRIEHKLGKFSPPKGHRTIEELVTCPECFGTLVSKIEDALIERGKLRPDLCSECGTELVKPLLGKPYCPKCKKPFLL